MVDYGRTSGTGGPGSSAIRNDDAETMDLPEDIDLEEFELQNVKPEYY